MTNKTFDILKMPKVPIRANSNKSLQYEREEHCSDCEEQEPAQQVQQDWYTTTASAHSLGHMVECSRVLCQKSCESNQDSQCI